MEARKVSLFRNGRSQALRIPKDFELPGQEALVRRVGQTLVIEPVGRGSLLDYLRTKEPLDEEFPTVERLPARPVEL